MTSREQFRTAWLRPVLSDVTIFPDSDLNNWIGQAVADYSINFPMPNYALVSAITAGQREFSFSGMSAEVGGITQVEYPIDKDPRQFLTRLSRDNPGFLGGQYYDLVGDFAIELGVRLKIGESFKLYFNTSRTAPLIDTSKINAPEAHLEAIRLFVFWKAVEKLELKHAQVVLPETTSLLLSMLGSDTGRAERSYRTKIDELKKNSGQGGFSGPWGMDRWDRVY